MSDNTKTSNVEFLDISKPDDYLDIEEGDEITLEEATGVVEYKYRAPKIAMGDEFKALPARDQARYMWKLANAMNHAAKLLQDERNNLLDALEKAKELNRHAETAVMIQKNIAANAIEQLNVEKQENAVRTGHQLSRIRNLETVVKAAGLKIE